MGPFGIPHSNGTAQLDAEMRIHTFFSFTSLFLTASVALFLTFILYNTPNPWELDAKHNRMWLHAPANLSLSDQIVQIATSDPELLLSWVRHLYVFCCLCLFMASSITILITFLAVRNRILVLSVHTLVCLWFLMLGWHAFPFDKGSIHVRTFITLFALNLIGSACYLYHLIYHVPHSSKSQSSSPSPNTLPSSSPSVAPTASQIVVPASSAATPEKKNQ